VALRRELWFTNNLFSDLEDIKEDVKFLKTTPYLREELAAKVRGYFYDIKTGLLQEVDE
jgi:carbonic anhydrase